MKGERMSDYAVYLGEGVWWQLTDRQRLSGCFKDMPLRMRPWKGFSR